MILDYCSKQIPILFHKETMEIGYKDNLVPFEYIKRAYESGYDKVRLSHNLFYRKQSGLCDFGCLTLTEEKVKQLIKKVCKLLKA
jgi:hypothetical protein